MENQIALQREWQSLVRVWGADPDLIDREFADFALHYSSPNRFYHTLNHVQQVLETVQSLSSAARKLSAVKLAAWLHDVIYDSQASDNEEQSAAYAVKVCKDLAIPDADVVASLILKTKTHEAGDDPDAQVLLDADLAILGAAAPVYREYAANIRKEYAWVPEADYRTGRRKVLEKFLARSRIYHLLEHLEETARRNLAEEIAELAGQGE
jgi:predicted metal-dependent HD superfamily phosphohydrolase